MSDVWRKWPVTASWAEPCEVVGTVATLPDPSTKFPTFMIRTPEGLMVTINVVQARLHELLAQAAPDQGDKIRIRYLGEADRAAPGMSPTKQFTVEIWRKGSQSPAGAEVRGSASENGAGTGK